MRTKNTSQDQPSILIRHRQYFSDSEASSLGLTGKAYVWVVTQSVVGSNLDQAPEQFPMGMLGVHFR